MNELTTTPAAPMTLLVGADLSSIDADKIGKLMELQSAWEDRNAKRQFNEALAAFQSAMPPVFKGRDGPRGNYRFAAYEDIMKIARPVLRANGLAVSFSQEETDLTLTVRCKVSHIAGHSEETPFTLPKDGPIKSKEGHNVTSQAQAQGSANSYAKRYCLCNALDIVVTGEDNDGADALTEYVTREQSDELAALVAKCPEGTLAALLDWAQCDSLADMPAGKFAKAAQTLKTKIKA